MKVMHRRKTYRINTVLTRKRRLLMLISRLKNRKQIKQGTVIVANRNKKTNRINFKNVTAAQVKDTGLHVAVILLAAFAIKGVFASLDGGLFVRSIIAVSFISALLFAMFLLIEKMKSN